MTADEEAIHRTLAQCLLAGQLAPGSQLVEVRLARIFGVTRERVRKVLHRLGHERLLELVPNRGAFVASPTLAEAREIYEARRVLEGGIVGRLAGALTPDALDGLRAHGRLEQRAAERGTRAESIRLSGQFHVRIAQCTGNPYIVRQLDELVSRTAMLVAFFEHARGSSCACDEHAAVVDALAHNDAARAMSAMHTHLSLIETRLFPRIVPATDNRDVEHVLRRAWGKRSATPRSGARGIPVS